MGSIAIVLALQDAAVSVENSGRNQFVQQTSLVVDGIRAGYLVDAFPFPQRKFEPWFRALTARLPKTDDEVIAILYEQSSDSLFIVNRVLLLDNLKSRSVPIWVNTDDCSVQVSCYYFIQPSNLNGLAAQLPSQILRHLSLSFWTT